MKFLRKLAYDSECFLLAGYFLKGEPSLDTRANREQLAQDIQDAVENFISEQRDSPSNSERQ